MACFPRVFFWGLLGGLEGFLCGAGGCDEGVFSRFFLWGIFGFLGIFY